MKRILSLIILLLAFFVGAMAKGDKIPQYDITGAGSGTEGTILVKVYVYSKSVKDEDLKRAAVHGVVFRGCSGNQRCHVDLLDSSALRREFPLPDYRIDFI